MAGGSRAPWQDLIADVAVVGAMVFFGRQLRSGFARGVLAGRSGRTRRDTSPIGFRLMMAIYALFFLLFGYGAITYAIQVVEGRQPL